MLFPLEEAGAGGGGFSFWNVPGVLEADGECGVGERVLRGEDGKSESDGDGEFELVGVAQGTDEAVMGFDVIGVLVDDGAEVTGGGLGVA